MDMIEIRLSGPKATLSHICRAIDRQLTQGPLERVELRYSTQASKPLGHQQAKQAIADLLRENGMNGTAVSVRAHEAPLDVASGDHVVRLFPRKDRPSATQPQSVRTGVAAWLERWFPKWFKPKPVEPHGAGSEPAQPPGHAAISSQQAVLLLRQAVGNAAHYRQTGSKTLVVGDAEEFSFQLIAFF